MKKTKIVLLTTAKPEYENAHRDYIPKDLKTGSLTLQSAYHSVYSL